MAHKTQMRLHQISGSIIDIAYSGSQSSVAAPTALDHSGFNEVMGQIAGAIGRISGKNSDGANGFTNAAAGNFYQALTVNAAGGITIGAGGDELVISESSDDALITNAKSDKDIIFRVNDGGSANTEVFRVDGSASSLLMAASKRLQLGAAEEALYGDGTDIHFEVGANGDINIPANIGLTFGDDGEKIEGNGTDLTIGGNNIVLEVTGDVKIDTNKGLVLSSDGNEKIESDGDDITFTVGAGGDVNIGTDIGLTFGNDGEKIEGNGTQLKIQGANILLEVEAGGDVKIDTDRGLQLSSDGNEKIESDGTDINFAVGTNGDINIPANIGLTFGDDGEKIEGNGTDLTIAGNNIVLEATADVKIDSNVGLLLSSDGNEKIESDGDDITFTVGAGGDINIGSAIGLTFGNDGEKIEGDGTDLTVASSAKINLTATSDVHLPNSVGLVLGDAGEKIEGDGTDLFVASSNNLNMDIGNKLIIDAQGTDSGDGVEISLGSDTSDTKFAIKNNTGTEKFSVDGAGTVTLANDLSVTGNLTVSGTTTTLDVTNLNVEDPFIFANDGAQALNSNTGIVFASGSNVSQRPDVVFGRVANNVFALGTIAGSSGSLTDATSMNTGEVSFRVKSIELNEGAESISGDGTDITFAVGANGDINIPSNIGLTFGNDGEKIEGDGSQITVAGANVVLECEAGGDVKIDTDIGLLLSSDGNEKIESDGNDISITIGAGGDLNLGSSIGLTFGDDGEKIEGDGTDLTIASSAKLNLSATSDVILPNSVGMLFGDVSNGGEKIEGDGTDLTIASSAKINLSATSDVILPNSVGMLFGDVASGGEKIEGDGTDLTIASSAKLNLTATSDVIIPSGVGLVLDGSGAEKIESDGTNITIDVGAGGDVKLPNSIGIIFGDAGEKIEADGTDMTIASSGLLNLNVTTAAVLPSGIPLRFADSGESISGNGTNLTLASGADINLNATADINIPANIGLTFGGTDNEKIEGDGTDLFINSTGTISTACTFFEVGNGTVNQARFKLYEDGTNGGNFIEFRVPEAITANVVFQLPDGDGDAGQFLQTDGNGILSYATVGGGASVKTFATVQDNLHEANTNLALDGGFSATDYSSISVGNANKSIDVYVNGQLLQSGSGPYTSNISAASYTSGDYLIDFKGAGSLTSLDVKFAFALEKDDVVCIIGRA